MIYACRYCGTVLTLGHCVDGQFCNDNCQTLYNHYIKEVIPVRDVFNSKIMINHTVLYFSDGKADSGNFARVVEIHTEKGIDPYIILEYMGKSTGPEYLKEYVQREKGQRSRKITAYNTKIIVVDKLVKMVQLDPTVGHATDPIEDRNEILDL
jgi:nitrogen regulatory protein PII-like uncharacterized protein